MNTRKLLQIIVFSMLVLGSGFAKDLDVFIMQPPEVVFDDVKTIAILPFTVLENNYASQSSDYGQQFAGYLTTVLVEERRGVEDIERFYNRKEGITYQDRLNCNIYDIVERSRVESIINELGFSLSGVTSDSNSSRIGEMLGAQAMIMGEISIITSDRQVREDREKDKKKYTISCTERIVNTTINIRLVSTETGKTLASRTYPNPSQSRSKDYQCVAKSCNDPIGGEKKIIGIPIPTSGNSTSYKGDCGSNNWDFREIVQHHLRKMATEFAAYIAPTFVLGKYDLEKIKFKDKAFKQYEKDGEEAKNFAKDGSLHRAYAIYSQILNHDENNPELLYNIGVLEEIVGNYDLAEEYYSYASQLKPNEKDYKEAVKRIEKQLSFREKLATINVVFEPFEWLEKETEVNVARIEITQRADVRKDPSEGSPVISSVKAGTSFPVIAQEGDWFLIKMLRKQGYIHRQYLKEVK